jgi:cell division septum initiation protein DivIVA
VGDGTELVPLRTEFDVVFRGYRRGPVREYVRGVEAELRLLAADRDANAELAQALAAEVEQLRADNARLRARLDRVCRTPIEPDALQERLRRMLQLATEEAGEITARAQAAAELCWAAAEDAAGRLRVRYEESIAEADRARHAMEVEHRALLRQARADAAMMTTEADRQRAQSDARAEHRRAQIAADFELAMAARRTEAMRAVAEQKVAAREEATRLIEEATQEAAHRVATAHREVDRLHDLRRHLATRLRAARDVLTAADPLDDTPRPTAIPQQRDAGTPQPATDPR